MVNEGQVVENKGNDGPKLEKITKQIMCRESFREETYFDKYFKAD